MELLPSRRAVPREEYESAWGALMAKVAARSALAGLVPLEPRSFSMREFEEEVQQRESLDFAGEQQRLELANVHFTSAEEQDGSFTDQRLHGATNGEVRAMSEALEAYLRASQLARFEARRQARQKHQL